MGDLSFVGALWLAASGLGFGALLPLAARRARTGRVETPSLQPGADLPEAA